MKFLSRVVWSEGMYLAPHHFQRQSRYFEESLRFAATSLWYKPYGLAGCEMDAEALQNGTVSILHARGILPDGLGFDIPGADPAPEPRGIGSLFSPTRDSHFVLLGVPVWRQDGGNVSSAAHSDRFDNRYIAEARLVADETTGRDEKLVELGRKNLRILLDTEIHEDLVVMPLARVHRDGAGRFVYDSEFVPPLLWIGASEHVMTLLRELCDVLEKKSRAIDEPRKRGNEHPAEYYPRDLRGFWFLHTIQSSLGPLRHQLLVKKGHPEELYRELVRLGGALSCFSLEGDPRSLPLYDHDDPSACFNELNQRIRSGLDLIAPTNYVSIRMKSTAPSFWSASVDDPRFFGPSRWILGISSKAGESAVITKVPHLVKVCSEKFIAELVRRAVSGLALMHLPMPPPALRTNVEAQYFSITKAGPCWEHIAQTKSLGVYVPGDLPNPELEVHIIMEQ